MKNLYKIVGITFLICISTSLKAQTTAGTLTFTYNQPQPTSPALNAGIKNVLAVWISNGTDVFVKTKYRFVSGSTSDHLPTWTSKSGGTSNATATACNTTDGISGATCTSATSTAGTTPAGSVRPTAFGSKTITWDAKNVVGTTNGTVVVDGTYKVWIESTWVDSGSNNHNELISFSFTKGTTAVHLTPTGDTYINSVVLDWVPQVASTDELKSSEPSVVIYPVPSTGVFNIDLKNQVSDIKVFNLLGQTIYTEKIEGNVVDTTKQIDLSGFSNGSYVISLTNEFGTSNYEIVINK
jgi:hypothetical protein